MVHDIDVAVQTPPDTVPTVAVYVTADALLMLKVRFVNVSDAPVVIVLKFGAEVPADAALIT